MKNTPSERRPTDKRNTYPQNKAEIMQPRNTTIIVTNVDEACVQQAKILESNVTSGREVKIVPGN